MTLPGIAPGILAAALLVFALSIDDYVITSFVAGVGSTTLPLQIYSMVRSGISPEINAVSTLLLVATALLLLAAWRLEQGARLRAAALPALLGLGILGAPFVLVGLPASPDRVLNVYIWSAYLPPETVRAFEAREGVRVNVDLYDSNEALLAKMQAGTSGYDVICPSNYAVETLVHQGLLRPLDHSLLPHLANVDPFYLDRDFDPGNRHSTPYFAGTCGIGYRRSRVGDVDSWEALWDPRFRGRVLMVDDPRETLGAALRRLGLSVNTVDEAPLRQAQRLLIEQKPLVLAYDSANFEDTLLAGDVWLAQGWSGEFARVIDIDPDIAYVIPKEGSTAFLDNLAIPASAPHPALAHRFLDFVMEAEVAAEICLGHALHDPQPRRPRPPSRRGPRQPGHLPPGRDPGPHRAPPRRGRRHRPLRPPVDRGQDRALRGGSRRSCPAAGPRSGSPCPPRSARLLPERLTELEPSELVVLRGWVRELEELFSDADHSR